MTKWIKSEEDITERSSAEEVEKVSVIVEAILNGTIDDLETIVEDYTLALSSEKLDEYHDRLVYREVSDD